MIITAAAISAFITATNTSIKILNKISQIIESEAIRGDLAEIRTQLFKGNSLILQLQAEIAQARAEKEQLSAKDNLRNDYELVKAGAGFAYRLRPVDKRLNRLDEPDHFICQSCADREGVRTILRETHNGKNLYCSRCESIVA